MQPFAASFGSLDSTMLMGLAMSWAKGPAHGYVATADYDDTFADTIVSEVTAIERRDGIFAAAAAAVVCAWQYPVFPSAEDRRVHAMFGCYVAGYMLRRASGILPDQDQGMVEAVLAILVDEAEQSVKIARVQTLLCDAVITCPPEVPSHPGLGLRAEIVVSVTNASDERNHIARVSNKTKRALESFGFHVDGPNDHHTSEDPGAACGHSTGYDVLVVVAKWPSWRGGSQVDRAHAMARPVLALIPEGSGASCLFSDPADGLTHIEPYRDEGDLVNAIGRGLDALKAALATVGSSSAERASRYGRLHMETLAAVSRMSTDELSARLPATVPVQYAHRTVASLEAFISTSLEVINIVRIAAGLATVHEQGDPYRALLSEDHRVNVDAFAENRGLDAETKIELEKVILRDLSELAAGRHRAPRHLAPGDLDNALGKIRGN